MRIFKCYILPALVLTGWGAMFFGGARWHEHGYGRAAEDLAPEASSDGLPRESLFHTFRPGQGGGLKDAIPAEELGALGYLSGYVEAPAVEGVTIHERERVYAGLNLYTSGHAPEAYLMDMEGTILHQWSYPIDRLWPDDEFAPPYFRRTHLFDNGDLLAIFEPVGIFKLDKDSNLLWSMRNRAHHDLSVLEDGTIFVLTQKIHPVLWLTDYGTVVDDRIAQLSPDGEPVREVSLLECFRNSPYSAYLERTKPAGDVLHTNALKFIDGRHADRSPIFRRGNFLVSLRDIDVVAIVDIDAQDVVWALSGMWFRQHEPTLLDNGNLLLFDNRGNDRKSKVIELDPITQEVIWTYGSAEDEPLHSSTCGLAARLPNGNTLITESNNGRALEVTPQNEIVWEYVSPHRAGEENELIATLLDMVRLPPTFSLAWLPAKHVISGSP